MRLIIFGLAVLTIIYVAICIVYPPRYWKKDLLLKQYKFLGKCTDYITLQHGDLLYFNEIDEYFRDIKAFNVRIEYEGELETYIYPANDADMFKEVVKQAIFSAFSDCMDEININFIDEESKALSGNETELGLEFVLPYYTNEYNNTVILTRKRAGYKDEVDGFQYSTPVEITLSYDPGTSLDLPYMANQIGRKIKAGKGQVQHKLRKRDNK